ncbi:hypothetical protein EVAR_20863_1 [Eumeta japonica]|uniref:Uncharacterized protein n=1 Tax=Eumeta variegata TaxID=151549 RepID=A0A4C1UDT5_EUMVA|nr:hypothetical protein EVAR_20863_1 [Eumeta japonica]
MLWPIRLQHGCQIAGNLGRLDRRERCPGHRYAIFHSIIDAPRFISSDSFYSTVQFASATPAMQLNAPPFALLAPATRQRQRIARSPAKSIKTVKKCRLAVGTPSTRPVVDRLPRLGRDSNGRR